MLFLLIHTTQMRGLHQIIVTVSLWSQILIHSQKQARANMDYVGNMMISSNHYGGKKITALLLTLFMSFLWGLVLLSFSCFLNYFLTEWEIVEIVHSKCNKLLKSFYDNSMQLFSALILQKQWINSSLCDPSQCQRISLMFVIRQLLKLYPWRNNFIQFNFL